MAEYKLSFTADEINEKLASQADFVQNDTTAFDYIKNRPFYVTEGEPIFDEDVTTSLEDDGTISVEHPTTAFNELGADGNFSVIYTIECDGTIYQCQSKLIGELGVITIGNSYLLLKQLAGSEVTVEEFVLANPIFEPLNVDTGEPFLIYLGSLDSIFIVTEEAGTYHLKITQNEFRVNSTFAPHLQANYDQDDPNAHDYIKNRPFYTKIDKILDGNITTTKDEDDNYAIYSLMHVALSNIVVGDTIDVVFDGVSYSLTGIAYGDSFVLFGNGGAIVGIFPEDAEPFGIFVMSSMAMILTKEANTHSMSITYTNIKKFSSKYIDWEGDVPTGGTIDPSDVLPKVTTADNDKVLMVVDGVWQPALIADGDEVSY